MSPVCRSCGQENPEGFRLCGMCGAALTPAARAREERKVVTVLFADLVGFTSRAERMDPEEVRALQAPYFARVRTDIERFGGTVEKFIGDAVMALFGAPVAHEDDPERAVRAALAIRDWIAEEQPELQVRLACTTGEALISLGARPSEGEGMASGDVVNTAARLQSAAPPNGVLVDETTYRATERAIEYREHTAVAAKGKNEPVLVWEGLQARGRLGTDVRQIGRSAFVGRERELDVLVAALARVRQEREPQLVTLVGVPGIGKSRLVWELFQAVDSEPELTTWRQGRSLPYGEGVAFWALSEMVKAESGILETDDVDVTAAKLQTAVDAVAADEGEAAWLFRNLGALVGLTTDTLESDRRAESYAAWRRFFEALGEQRPLVLVFEDLHWADESLLDFIDHLVEWATGVPILIVCTARPELLAQRPGWGGGKPNATTLSLSPLSHEETSELVASLVGDVEVPEAQQQELLDRAGGNPLYAEEFVRLAAETRDGDLPLPETVQGLIAARLDTLGGDEKALVHDAAVVGKVFWLGALVAVGGTERWTVESDLHALERRELVRRERRSSVAAETEYAFRHILVRDVAYAQIPRAKRAEKHLHAAAWIEGLGRPDEHAEMLAYHYLEALRLRKATGGDVDAAAAHARAALRTAAERALALGAIPAASGYLESALELWPLDDAERPYVLLMLGRARRLFRGAGEEPLLEARDALAAAGDVASTAEAEMLLADLAWYAGDGAASASHLDRARELISEAPPSKAKALVLGWIARFEMRRGRSALAIALGDEALELARLYDAPELESHILIAAGPARAHAGDITRGIADLERAIAVATARRSPDAPRAFNNLGSVVAMSGDLRRAAALNDQCLVHARRLGMDYMVSWATGARTWDAYALGRWDEGASVAAQFLDALDEAARQMEDFVRRVRARIAFARGDVDTAIADVDEQLKVARRIGDPQSIVPALAVAARISFELGRAADAAALADELLAAAGDWNHASGENEWAETAFVLSGLGRGDDLLAAAARAPATKWTRVAMEVAQGDFVAAAATLSEIGALPDEAFARMRAAEKLRDAGRVREAEDQLASAVAFWRSVGATRYVHEVGAKPAPTP